MEPANSNFGNHLKSFANEQGYVTYHSMFNRLCGVNEDRVRCAITTLAVLHLFKKKELIEYIDPNSNLGPKYNWQIKITRVIEGMHPAAMWDCNNNEPVDRERFKFIFENLDLACLDPKGRLQPEALEFMLDKCEQRDEQILAELQLEDTTAVTTTEDIKKPATPEELIAALEEIHQNMRQPNIWNSQATQPMINFNKRFGKEGVFMHHANECNHPAIVRLLHLLNYIATKTLSGVIEPMAEEGYKREDVEIMLNEFLTQAYFFLALLGRNEQARKKIIKYQGVKILISLMIENSKNKEQFANSCFALGQILTSVDGGQPRQLVINGNYNLIHRLFTMLKNNLDSPRCVQHIFFVLGNAVCIWNLEAEILAEKGVECALTCLNKHKEIIHAVNDIVFFLKNMAVEANTREILQKHGCIQSVVPLLVTHRNHLEFVDFAVNLISDMTFQPDSMRLLVNSPQIASLFISLIQQHRENFSLAEHCIKVLTRMYLNLKESEKNLVRTFLIKGGYTDVLIYLYTTFKEDAKKLSVIQSIFDGLREEGCPSWSLYMPDFHQVPQNSDIINVKDANNPNAVNSGENDNANNKILEKHVFSLKELAARCIKNTNMILVERDVNSDIVAYLNTAKKCHLCRGYFIDHYYEVIHPALFAPLQQLVPLFWQLCSNKCRVKLLTITPPVPQIVVA